MALTSKKAAATAKERATTLHDDADKATTAVEQTVVTAVGEVAKLTRQAQQAAYEDAQAFFSGVDQLASAKCLGEAVQIYVDYMRNRSDVAVARARTARDLFSKLVASGANTKQKTIANDVPFKGKWQVGVYAVSVERRWLAHRCRL